MTDRVTMTELYDLFGKGPLPEKACRILISTDNPEDQRAALTEYAEELSFGKLFAIKISGDWHIAKLVPATQFSQVWDKNIAWQAKGSLAFLGLKGHETISIELPTHP